MKPNKLSREEWQRRHEKSLAAYNEPHEIRIVCSHKGGTILNKRPATLGVAVVELDRSSGRDVFLNWNPHVGNMNNRMNRKASYNPVAIDEAVQPPSAAERRRRGIPDDYMETHDLEGIERRGVKGMSSVRRNAVTNHYADQLICPRCTMHVNRNHDVLKRILRGLADEGVGKLDIQYIDTYAAMLPEPVFRWL